MAGAQVSPGFLVPRSNECRGPSRGARLALPVLARGIVPPSILLQTMAGFGFFPPGPIRPVIVISYSRRRFVEPFTGYRLSIDSHIRSSLLIPGRECGERGLELPGAVVEVKCPVLHLPPALRQLADIGSSWSRFSKYSACLEAHDAERGTVSRLWPSGLIEDEPGSLARVGGPSEKRANPPGPAPRSDGEYRNRDREVLNMFHSLATTWQSMLSSLTFTEAFIAIGFSVVFSLVVYFMYQLFYGSRHIGAGVHRMFLLGGPAITMLFLGIQTSIPLSLGLLGALSFVRFRTPVKDPAEIGFLLLLIASSIGASSGNFMAVTHAFRVCVHHPGDQVVPT